MDIEIRLLRHARALADHGTFSRAARALSLTQPALTRSIQVLEQAVGAKLFVRRPGGVAPTDAGQMLLDRAAEVLSRSEELTREMNLLRGVDRGDLRIGAGLYPAEMFVGRAVASLASAHPGIRVQILNRNWADLLPMLIRRDVDLIIANASTVAEDPELHFTWLRRRQGYFVTRVGHPLAGARDATLADVVRYPIAATTRLTPSLIEPLLRASAGATAVPSLACESLSMIKSIVAGSDAIGILPLCVVAEEIASSRLTVLPRVEPWLAGHFAAIRLARRSHSPSCELFLRLVLEADEAVFALEERLAAGLFPASAGPGAVSASNRPRAPRASSEPAPRASAPPRRDRRGARRGSASRPR